MPRSRSRAAAAALAACAWLAAPAAGERLPWTVYDSSDGLAGDGIRELLEDSRGLLWIATGAGLSRFDGRSFVTYDSSHGLPSPLVEGLAETRDGSIWVSTERGLARLRPGAARGPRLFEVETLPAPFGPGGADRLFVDARGALLVSRGAELARYELDATGGLRGGPLALSPGLGAITALTGGADGTVWVGGERGLVRVSPEGGVERFRLGRAPETDAAPGIEQVRALAVDRSGRLWIGGAGVLVAWLPEPPGAAPPSDLLARARRPRFAGDLPGRPGEAVVFGAPEGLSSPHVNSIAAAGDEIWAATRGGLFVVAARGTRALGSEHGLAELGQTVAFATSGGTLWFGTESRGLERLGRSGFETFGERDGLVGDRASALFESPPGALFVVTGSRELHRFDGAGFERVTPRALFPRSTPGWGWNQSVLVDRRGRLWFPTGEGLFRFAPVARAAEWRAARPERHFAAGSELPGADVFRVYEDRAGDVWVSTISEPCLTRFAGGERPEPVPEVEPCSRRGAPTSFAEDRDGNLWIGFYGSGLARVAGRGWRFFDEDDGAPPGFVYDLHVDLSGALWVATGAGGVARIDEPGSERPRFRRFTARDGLATDNTRCLADDGAGRILVGTARGVDRLDPETGGIRWFSTADGLPNSVLHACLRTAGGSIWFGTLHGLARFVPPPERPPAVPPVWLVGLAVGGVPRELPERGVASLGELALAPGWRSLRLEFAASSLELGGELRYQHRVLGADGAWSAPSAERAVQLAALAPGDYRFEVRTTTREGAIGPNVAAVDLRVLPPLWRRGWSSRWRPRRPRRRSGSRRGCGSRACSRSSGRARGSRPICTTTWGRACRGSASWASWRGAACARSRRRRSRSWPRSARRRASWRRRPRTSSGRSIRAATTSAASPCACAASRRICSRRRRSSSRSSRPRTPPRCRSRPRCAARST